jgi:hypothetical protein
MSKCIKCGEAEATVPDRDSGSNRKRLCGNCHAKRLRGDLAYILALKKKEDHIRREHESRITGQT